MNEAAQFLIDGYLDDVLTIEQHEELSTWIRSSPQNARKFAAAVMLHDRLRNEMIVSGERQGVSPPCAAIAAIAASCRRPATRAETSEARRLTTEVTERNRRGNANVWKQ